MPRRQAFTIILPVSGLLSSFCHFLYYVPGTLEGKVLYSHLFQCIIDFNFFFGISVAQEHVSYSLNLNFFKIILVVDF